MTAPMKKPVARTLAGVASRPFFGDQVKSHSAAARRFRAVLADVLVDLGGADSLSETHRHLARRFAALTVQAEIIESALVAGEPVDVDVLTRLIGMMSRLSTTLGLRQVVKDTGPDLAAYAASQAGARE